MVYITPKGGYEAATNKCENKGALIPSQNRGSRRFAAPRRNGALRRRVRPEGGQLERESTIENLPPRRQRQSSISSASVNKAEIRLAPASHGGKLLAAGPS